MRYSTTNGNSDLWQRVLYVLLGVASVVLCYLAGAYWIGPWLHQMRQQKQEVASAPSISTTTAPVQPSTSAPFSPVTPKLAGVQIRERDPNTLPDTVRVIPSGDGALPESNATTEEPQPPTTLEETPSTPPPPANLWTPEPQPSRPSETPPASPGGVQVPESLNSEPTPADTMSSTDTLYRVRLPDAFDSREQADTALRSLTDRGLPGAVVTDTVGGRKVFRVQLGVYRNRPNAEKLAEQARRAGIPAEVTSPSP
ncbi:MAG: SPOR domain-containing protein [Chthonomonadetes bacterium]|nr:SPOR domain-containing protein [Chthonomonadetes bacterium]